MADKKSLYPSMSKKDEPAKKPDDKPAEPKKDAAPANAAEPDKPAAPADESGGDALNTMLKGQTDARAEMVKRHEKERRDFHGTMRDQMRAMQDRHESEYSSMNDKHLSDMGGISPPGSADAAAAVPGATPAAAEG